MSKLQHLQLFARHARQDVHAERFRKGEGWAYRPVPKPLSDEDLRRHLDGGPPLGAYLMSSGSNVTRIAVLDLDDHDGTVPWDQMGAIALRIASTARHFGVNLLPVRSGGGHGIHLEGRWDAPQPAADVRRLAQTILAAEGFADGAGGIIKGEIEIFPKQNSVEDGGYGNPIALPFARSSVPLDATMQPCAEPPMWVSSAPVARAGEEETEEGGTADVETVASALKAIGNNDLDYGTWVKIGMAIKAALGDEGRMLWRQFSALYPENVPAETESKWRSFKPSRVGVGFIFRLASEKGWAAPAQYAPAFSEEWMALRFADEHRAGLRYVAKHNRYFEWVGTHWQVDDTLRAFDLSRALCRKIAAAANKKRAQIASARTVAAVERLAKVDRRIAATADQWDRDPWLLGTPEGTVDLRTGELRPSRREDYITKITRVAPGGECPRWLRFIEEITGGNVELARYLQRLAGYSLTGSVREHAFIFLHGDGTNGKTTFVETMAHVLGDYATVVAMNTLVVTSHPEHPTEIAKLCGRRLAAASETKEGMRWNVARIKLLSGGDSLTARFMRGDYFDFLPSHKLMIYGNKRPLLGVVDQAIRRRLHLVPFKVRFDRPDKELGERLRDEAGGILTWMIGGCLAWQATGLAPPKEVAEATEKYLREQDDMALWMDECCATGRASYRQRTSELFESWKGWAERNGAYAGSVKAFSQTLEARGFVHTTERNYSAFTGIQLGHEVDC